jgi:hypothetical protein
MTDTPDLITALSTQALPVKVLRSPMYFAVRLILILALYGIACQLCLGVRPDLALHYTRPLFVMEIGLLLLLLLSSIVASVLTLYPDGYQKPHYLKLPYVITLLFIALLTTQSLMPQDTDIIMADGAHVHDMECALCIVALSLIPSALIFMILRKGASVKQHHAGMFAVLAAASLGCLIIRFAEPNDAVMHLVQWHYIPTMLYAIIGACAGKWLLEW